MKQSKKKKRARPPVSKPKQLPRSQNPKPDPIHDQVRVFNSLADGVASVSIADDSAQTVINLTDTASSSSATRDDDAAEIFGSSTETGSSSSGSSGLGLGLSNCDDYNRTVGGKVNKGGRGSKVVAATGMVSSVIGKDYVPCRKRGVNKMKGSGDGGVSYEDAEQFLCSMLGGDCELGMDLVKDVLCQTAYDVEKMAMQAESPAGVLPSAQVVGNAFVEQYYHILHQSPELVHKFYQDSSILSRPDANGLMSSVTTMQAIDEKIQSLDYKNYKPEIKTADAQDSHQSGVIVLVTGCLTGKDNVKRKFAQTFFLAPQEKGYFVQNDVFRFVEESAPLDRTSSPVENIIESAPADLPIQSSEVTNISDDNPTKETSTNLVTEDLNIRPEICELTQEVLESLFNAPKTKSSKHEPGSMNWRNVVKKMESLGQSLDYSSQDTFKEQHIPAKVDDYHDYRTTANQHWDSMNSYYHKAATAFADGKREYAAYLSDQGRIHNEKARQADERASQDIFNARNKDIENVITIDLHGQHVKQGMKLLKLHLFFGAYVRSVRLFRVITGCGSHGLGKPKIKQSVVNLLEAENIEWKEENRGTLLIKLNGQREFSFLDSTSDSD